MSSEGSDGERLRVAIMSDLHAYDGDLSPPPSWLKMGAEGTNPLLHPIAGLEQLIADDRSLQQTDLLLCPGDLGDKAQPAGVKHGWDMVQRARGALGNPLIVATTGNHDVSSRPNGPALEVDSTEILRELDPLYPYDDRATQQAFFSDHYAIVQHHGWRVVTLNTSAHHGTGEREYDHGRVTSGTRERLLRDLRQQGPSSVNILLCHHHPIEYTAIDEPDRSTIVGGALLMAELAGPDLGPWIIVHGHKHIPHLSYGPGAGTSPVVFSAGSLAASFHMGQQAITRNQFYWLEFDLQAARDLHHGLACRFRSWYWVPNRGWIPTDPGSGLPAEGGFGVRGDPRRLAEVIRTAVYDLDKPSIEWAELVNLCPEVEFLIPADLDGVAAELERMGWSVCRDTCGRYQEVAGPWQ
jgi:hypothetical protein